MRPLSCFSALHFGKTTLGVASTCCLHFLICYLSLPHSSNHFHLHTPLTLSCLRLPFVFILPNSTVNFQFSFCSSFLEHSTHSWSHLPSWNIFFNRQVIVLVPFLNLHSFLGDSEPCGFKDHLDGGSYSDFRLLPWRLGSRFIYPTACLTFTHG